MDLSREWETEYLCSRVKRIEETLKNENYEGALDYLNMIQEKAKNVENMIRKHLAIQK